MKDFNNFLETLDSEKLSYDAVHGIVVDISDAYDYISPEALEVVLRVTQGSIKAYLRAYHTWILQQLSAESNL